MNLGTFLDHFGIILGAFWDHLGIILGSFWDYLVPWGPLGLPGELGAVLGGSLGAS